MKYLYSSSTAGPVSSPTQYERPQEMKYSDLELESVLFQQKFPDVDLKKFPLYKKNINTENEIDL